LGIKRSTKYKRFELSLKLVDFLVEISKLFLDILNLAGNNIMQLLLEGDNIFTERQEPVGARGAGLDEFFEFLQNKSGCCMVVETKGNEQRRIR
jgi:hypothetical protein